MGNLPPITWVTSGAATGCSRAETFYPLLHVVAIAPDCLNSLDCDDKGNVGRMRSLAEIFAPLDRYVGWQSAASPLVSLEIGEVYADDASPRAEAVMGRQATSAKSVDGSLGTPHLFGRLCRQKVAGRRFRLSEWDRGWIRSRTNVENGVSDNEILGGSFVFGQFEVVMKREKR